MNAGRTIFTQLMDFVSPYEFRTCVDRYGGHYKVQTFSYWDQFLCLAFAQLYKCRWQVELFFKWLKQHLRITAFYGTSVNAVKTQVWIALSVYVLVAIVKKRLELPQSLYTILQILSVTLFEKTPIHQALAQIPDTIPEGEACNQLSLVDR